MSHSSPRELNHIPTLNYVSQIPARSLITITHNLEPPRRNLISSVSEHGPAVRFCLASGDKQFLTSMQWKSKLPWKYYHKRAVNNNDQGRAALRPVQAQYQRHLQRASCITLLGSLQRKASAENVQKTSPHPSPRISAANELWKRVPTVPYFTTYPETTCSGKAADINGNSRPLLMVRPRTS